MTDSKIKSFPLTRIATNDICTIGLRKHHIATMLEIDVTEARERIKQHAGTLSGGEQQMLAMGRGLMSSPELILLDEPSLGLAPLLINTIFDIIIEIKNMGKTILLVEQNAFKALSIADKAYVLEQGVVTMEGLASDLIKDEKIQEAYLGKKKLESTLSL